MFAICEVVFLDHLSLRRVQLASSTSHVQISEKCFERLRVGASPSRSQQHDEGGSRSRGGTRRSSRRRTQDPCDEDENNQLCHSLQNTEICFLLVFCFTVFWVNDVGVFKKLLSSHGRT